MSSLSMVESRLPPGFRFHPKDEELICDYLMKWIMGCPLQFPLLIEVDLNKCEPWDIPETACVGGKEWYFYSQRDRKYATGLRTNRATVSGYWKATGKDRPVLRSGALIGMRKTLVFYQGRAPKGKKSDWVMHEFRLEAGPHPKPVSINHVKDQDWVLCRVFCKNLQSSSSDQAPTTPRKQENPNSDFVSTPSSSSLPPLTELPNYNIGFEHNNIGPNYNSQVPCFSTDTINQTSPYHTTFSLHMNPSQGTVSTNFGDSGILCDHNYNPPMLSDNCHLSSCDDNDDKKVIAAVLNHLTKKEVMMNNYQYGNNISTVKSSSSCSPSFVDQGNSESLLSEVGISSLWNHYS